MTLLDRYLGTRLLATVLKAVVSLVFLFIVIDLLTHRRTAIMNHNVPWTVVLRYYAAFTPAVLYKYQVAALAMLVAALLVFGNAAQHNEVIAALAGGISLGRLVRVPVLVALAVSLLMFGLQETVGLAGTREACRIEEQYFSQKQNRYMVRRGISWPKLEDDWTCHILNFNRLALTGEHAFLLAIREHEIEQIQARRIFWDPQRGRWILEDGHWLVFHLDRDWEYESQVIRQQPAPIRETPAELFALEQPSDTKSVPQLAADIRRAAARGIPVARHQVDLHAKFAQPALCFVMIWIAIPFAIRLRRGGVAIGFGVSVAIAVAYLMLFRLSMGLGYFDRLGPVLAAWSANALFLALGLVLFRRTAH